MPHPTSVYVHCDELHSIPTINRENWEKETDILASTLTKNATVLQIGCMNCSRLITLQKRRPDLRLTGIDIEPEFIPIGQTCVRDAGMHIDVKLCDITQNEQCKKLGTFDYVLCLNNTLGYIPDEQAALKNMRTLAPTVIVSVYADAFTDLRAREYFSSIHLPLKRIEGQVFHFDDFTSVKRFARKEVDQWNGKIVEMPLGFLCILGQA